MSTIKDERELLSPPGDTILETIEYMRMSQAELAKRMGKTPSKINDLISGKEPITVNTAFQLEKVLGIEAQFWLNREILYREKLQRIEQEEGLQKYIDWINDQPVKELRNCGFIKSDKKDSSLVHELLQFYGVDTPGQWESVYIDEYANTTFRKSKAHAEALGSMSAWLRIGEIELRRRNLPSYDRDKFKSALEKVLGLVEEHPEDFPAQLQEIVAVAGVAVVFTMSLPKAPISGAARWIGGRALIQITDRYKTNDQFWFTFFHESGHILLHGKKDVFIEGFEGYTLDDKKETEANEFASNTLLPISFLVDVPKSEITEKDIRKIARKFKTHPGIVVGRLQKLNIVHHSFGTKLKSKVILDYYIVNYNR